MEGYEGEEPNQIGDLYDRLMGKVNAAIEGQKSENSLFRLDAGGTGCEDGWG